MAAMPRLSKRWPAAVARGGQRRLGATAAGGGAPVPAHPHIRIRRAVLGTEDTAQVGALFSTAFSTQPHNNSSSSSSSASGSVRPGSGAALSAADWQQRLDTALAAKHDAAEQSRRRRADRRARIEAAELARQRGDPPVFIPVVTQALRQQMERWRRQRFFVVLVAEDWANGQVLGSAAVSLAQPEAALPPPFPTSKPRRVYVSNIAVLPQHRRQGVATALVRRCERQARLWRQDSLWLHCELTNDAALQLYSGLGYAQVRRDPPFTPFRRCLMRKEMPRCTCSMHSTAAPPRSRPAASSSSGGGGGGGGGGNGAAGQRPASGVYVWSEAVEEGPAEELPGPPPQ